MGIPLLIIAALLMAAAYQNQLGYLARESAKDVKGSFKWTGAMAVIGAIGLIPTFKPVSNALFFLVILVMFISNKAIFANLADGSAFTPISPPKAPDTPITKATAASAPPGTQKQGDIQQQQPSPSAQGGSTVGDNSGGIMSNIIPFPNLKFGGFDAGSILGLPTGGNTPPASTQGTSNVSDHFTDPSGVTIENIQITPNG